jgi:hypothetical protein
MTEQWAISDTAISKRWHLRNGQIATDWPAVSSAASMSLIEEGIRMIQNRLRLYCGPDANGTGSVTETKQPPETVSLTAGEVFAWLADAADNNRAWLHDFEDEQITMSSDLYEVILAYQHFRRPSA